MADEKVLNIAKGALCNPKSNGPNPGQLFAAWLSLHIENPGTHPDDYLSENGPYSGWHVLLAHQVMSWKVRTPAVPLPDELVYPGCFISLTGWGLDAMLEHRQHELAQMPIKETAVAVEKVPDPVCACIKRVRDNLGNLTMEMVWTMAADLVFLAGEFTAVPDIAECLASCREVCCWMVQNYGSYYSPTYRWLGGYNPVQQIKKEGK